MKLPEILEKFEKEFEPLPTERYKPFIILAYQSAIKECLGVLPEKSKIDWSKEKDCYDRTAEESGYNKAIEKCQSKIKELIENPTNKLQIVECSGVEGLICPL